MERSRGNLLPSDEEDEENPNTGSTDSMGGSTSLSTLREAASASFADTLPVIVSPTAFGKALDSLLSKSNLSVPTDALADPHHMSPGIDSLVQTKPTTQPTINPRALRPQRIIKPKDSINKTRTLRRDRIEGPLI